MDIMVKNSPAIPYKALSVASACAVLIIALFAFTTPITHAYSPNSGGGSYNNNGGSHNGNGGGSPNNGGNNNGGNGNNWGNNNNGGNHNGNGGGFPNNGGNNNGAGNNWGNNNAGGHNNNPIGYDPRGTDHRNDPPPFQDHRYPVPSYPHPDHQDYHQPPVIHPVTYYQPTQYIYQTVPSYSYSNYSDYYQPPVNYQTSYYQPPVNYQTAYYQPTQTYAYQTASYPSQYNTNGLNVSCSVDPSVSVVNQPVTWTAQVTGGAAPYSYSWSGSDGIYGSQSSATKYYGSVGDKTAIVTVTSADGLTGTRACGNTLTVRNAGGGGTSGAPSSAQTPAQNGNPNSAAAAFSLGNIPWGWIAVLVILVLIASAAYLLFNRPKI